MIEVTEEDMKMLEWGRKNDQWIKENYDELEKKYPDMWVAVHDGKVLESSKEFKEILKNVRKEYPDIEKYVDFEKIRTEPLFMISSFTLKH